MAPVNRERCYPLTLGSLTKCASPAPIGCICLNGSRSRPASKPSSPPWSFSSSSFATDHRLARPLIGLVKITTPTQVPQCSSLTHTVRRHYPASRLYRREHHETDSRCFPLLSSLPHSVVLSFRMGAQPHWRCSQCHCSGSSALKASPPFIGFQHTHC